MNSALLIYEKFVATLTEQQIKMFEEALKPGLAVAAEAIK